MPTYQNAFHVNNCSGWFVVPLDARIRFNPDTKHSLLHRRTGMAYQSKSGMHRSCTESEQLEFNRKVCQCVLPECWLVAHNGAHHPIDTYSYRPHGLDGRAAGRLLCSTPQLVPLKHLLLLFVLSVSECHPHQWRWQTDKITHEPRWNHKVLIEMVLIVSWLRGVRLHANNTAPWIRARPGCSCSGTQRNHAQHGEEFCFSGKVCKCLRFKVE